MKEEKPLGLEICCVANLLRRNLDKRTSHLETDDASQGNGWIIDYIYHHPDQDIFQKDIEKAFALTRSNISKVVDLMVQKGFIVRSSVDYDARLKKLTLTPKAIEIHHQVDKYRSSFEKRLMAEFTEEELAQFREYLHRMEETLRKTV